MEAPEFIAGSIKRFSEFISALNDKEKLALISHTDLDGLAAAKIANESLQADFLYFKGYEELTIPFLNEMKKQKIKHLVLTDLSLTNPDFLKEAEKYFKILIIDHHLFDVDLNSEKTVFLNAKGFCAAYLCYYLFSKIKNLEKYDWLIALASIADWAYLNNQQFMSNVFKKYGDSFSPENNLIKKSGKFYKNCKILGDTLLYFNDKINDAYNLLPNDLDSISSLEKYSLPVQNEISLALERFKKEKIPIKEGYFWEFSPKFQIGSLISTLLSEKEPNKKFIIARPKKEFYHISIRRQDGKENVCLLLQSLVSGLEKGNAGGHAKAAGGEVSIKDAGKIKQRILDLK